MSDWQRINWTQYGGDGAFSDQRCQFWRPVREFCGDTGQCGGWVGYIDLGDPVLRLVECHITLQRTVPMAMRHDGFTRCKRHQCAAADCLCGSAVAGVAAE